MPDKFGVGTYTDVFSFACVIYFVLTGEPMFIAYTPIAAMAMMRDKKRRSITEGKKLSPELRERVLLAREARKQRLHWEKVEKQAQEPLKGVSGRVGDVQIVSTTVNGKNGSYQKIDYRDL